MSSWKKLLKLRSRTTPVLVAGLLTACETLDTPSANVPFCLAAQPIYLDSKDVLTDDTAKQIEDHLCRGIKLCNWPERGLKCDG